MSTETKRLEKKLWGLFSQFIRMRDASQLNGYAQCCTCGSVKFWKEMDAGHFVGRQFKSLKFSEQNVNAQCRYCNRFNEGMKHKYAKFLDEKYGEGTAMLLDGTKKRVFRLDKFSLLAMIDHYKTKVAELKQSVPQDF